MNWKKAFDNSIFWKRAIFFIILLSSVIRLKVYVENRSFFHDEANLARNIVEKGPSDFFSTLDHGQYAPPLFLVETKLLCSVLGNKDWVMRLIPFISGLFAILVFWLILREQIKSDILVLFGLALLGLSPELIRYHTEFKQYGGDVLLMILTIWFCLQAKRMHREDWIFWAAYGAISIWYSMAMIFLLPGVFLFFLLKEKNLKILIPGFFWFLSFIIYFELLLSVDSGNDYLQDYFENYFLDPSIISWDTWTHNFGLLKELPKLLMDKTVVGILFGIVTMLVGLASCRKEKSLIALLTVPLVLLSIASCIDKYPIITRLVLFSFPMLALLSLKGLDYLWSKSMAEIKMVLSLTMLIVLVNKEGYTYLYTPFEDEGMTTILSLLKEKKSSEELVLLDHEAYPAFEYYNALDDNAFHLAGSLTIPWDGSFLEAAQADSRARWVIFSHTSEEEQAEILTELRTLFLVEAHYEIDRGALFSLRPK